MASSGVRRGVYADAKVWDDLDEYVGRPRLQTRAALATMRRGWVASHDFAAHEHGMETSTHRLHTCTSLVRAPPGCLDEVRCEAHLASVPASEQVQELERPGVLDMARMVVDMARRARHAVRRDRLRLRHATGRESDRHLEAAVEPMTFWPLFATGPAPPWAFADPGAESVLETLGLRTGDRALGVGEVETQFPPRTGGRSRGLGRHQGRVPHLRGPRQGEVLVRGPGRPRGPGRQPKWVWAEKKRERLHAPPRVSARRRSCSADYWNPDRKQVLKRMREEYDDTVARFGAELPEHLARNARELRRRFGTGGRRGA